MKVAFLRGSSIFDDSRATKEINALLSAGYRVDVYGWDREGNAQEKVALEFKQFEESISFDFFKGKSGKRFVGKVLSRIRWNKWLYGRLRENGSYSIVHSCDYDTGEMAYKYCRKKLIKYVYDIYDYYVDSHPIPSLVRNFFENREIKVINNAELTIICTEERKQQIIKASPKKLLVLHNSPDIEFVPKEEIKYDYIYCGALNDRRLLTEILELYPQNTDLRFLFGGKGAHVPQIIEMRDNYDNFDFLGAVSYGQVLRYEAKSHIISAIYDPQYRNHKLCAPNKFYEALALGKPVIVCKGTGIDNIVETNGIGKVIEYDANQFYDAVRQLLSNKDEMKRMGEKAREIYCREYKWSCMRDKLLQEYECLSKKVPDAI